MCIDSDRAFEIVAADPQGEDALSLLREAAIEARALYPELARSSGWPGNPPTPAGGTYLVGYRAGSPVGCVALRPMGGAAAEVRRMFVTRTARRGGLARELMAALELRARQLGYAVLRLETGNRQQPAIALYEALGFMPIAPFGEHANDPTSLCFEKPVTGVGLGVDPPAAQAERAGPAPDRRDR